MNFRQRLYVDPEIQFPLVLACIFLVTLEGFFVGWGSYRLIAIARDWTSPDQAAHFFRILAATLIPVVLCNFALGVWLSHKIAGPLVQMRSVMAEITRGNLEGEVVIRSGDFLQAPAQDLNRMLQTLRRLLYRDHSYAMEINETLTQLQDLLNSQKNLPDPVRKELEKLLADAKSRLSIINAHFIKGRKEEEGGGHA